MLAWSSVSSVCVNGCVSVVFVNWAIKCIAFDLGEALRCMPRCERLVQQLIVIDSDFVAAPTARNTSQFSAAASRGEGREVSFLFPTDSCIIGPFGG